MKRVLVLCVFVACKRHETAPSAPVVSADPSAQRDAATSASIASTPPPAPVTITDPCGEYLRRRDATLHAAIAGIGDAGPAWTGPALKTAIDGAGLHCFAFPRGAWWIDLGADLEMRWDTEISTHTTVRAVLDGHALAPWTGEDGAGVYVGYGGMPTTMTNALAGDYDGDGVPELWVRTDEDGVEGGHFSSSWILTVHDGKIAEYPPAKSLGVIGAPFDADGDGRLDLPVSLGLGTVEDACMGKPSWTPADLLAHSLPDGKFSTHDAVARAHAKRWCAAAPARVASREDALCARLWAAPADVPTIRARIAACVPWDCAAEAAGKPQKPGAAELCNDMLETFDQTVTFSLRP